MKRRVSWILAVSALVTVTIGMAAWSVAKSPEPPAEEEIQALLHQQVAAWNRGDLEGFLNGYWNSQELTFFTGSSVFSGWDATLERYRQRYQSPGAEMGRLDFADIQILRLSAEAALVRGRWQLEREEQEDAAGLFTLILRRFPNGWRIIHDHTS